MIDRSISSLRTLRPETDFDKSIFWFRDDLHQPYAISPMGMTTLQAHHAWGYHVAAEETKLPPSKGGHVKTYKGRVYIGFALIDDPDEISKREPRNPIYTRIDSNTNLIRHSPLYGTYTTG